MNSSGRGEVRKVSAQQRSKVRLTGHAQQKGFSLCVVYFGSPLWSFVERYGSWVDVCQIRIFEGGGGRGSMHFSGITWDNYSPEPMFGV